MKRFIILIVTLFVTNYLFSDTIFGDNEEYAFEFGDITGRTELELIPFFSRQFKKDFDNTSNGYVDAYISFQLSDSCFVKAKDLNEGKVKMWIAPKEDQTLNASSQGKEIIGDVVEPGEYYLIVSKDTTNNNYNDVNIEIKAHVRGDIQEFPIEVGSISSPNSYTHTCNTSYLFTGTNKWDRNDVYYKFELTTKLSVTISHCNSELSQTNMYLLNADGLILLSNENSGNRTIQKILSPGTYYVKSKGKNTNGYITTDINFEPIQGDDLSNPLSVGNVSAPKEFEHEVNTADYSNFYSSKSTNDVFYHFHLNNKMIVSVSHETSLPRTCIYLLDSNGNIIASNVQNNVSVITETLAQGDYYVVSEGYYLNGPIKTKISFDYQLGDAMEKPFDAGVISPGDDGYSDARNTNDYSNVYKDEQSQTNDVFHKFTLLEEQTVYIKHITPSISNSRIYLLSSTGLLIASNKQSNQPIIKKKLSAGDYYVISEGANENGLITISINGYLDGDKMDIPISTSIYSDNFTYMNTVNTSFLTNQYNGRNTKDVFHKFTIAVPMRVTITHEGSSLADTYMTLLGYDGGVIAVNDNYDGINHCSNSELSFIECQLNAGTYYVVSEGSASDGIITLNITGNSSEFGYPDIPSTYSSSSKSYGMKKGNFGVSSFGSATYSMPIEAPQGVGDLKPELAITYDSQQGNDICGYGAYLSGFSSITRGSKTIYHDGEANGISNFDNDALYLDGVRLILSSGQAGKSGAKYKLENDPYTTVTIKGPGTSLNDPSVWFEVNRNDGLIYIYGENGNARSYDDRTQTIVYSWHIDLVQQPSGPFIDYVYTPSVNHYVLPSAIQYGTENNYNEIVFSYENRSDIKQIRFDGRRTELKKRLKTITCKTGTEIFRIYSLKYNDSGDQSGLKYSRLVSIEEKNGEGRTLPETQFAWSYLPTASINTSVLNLGSFSSPLTINENIKYSAVDLNGDGIDEIIGYWQGNDKLYVRYADISGIQQNEVTDVLLPSIVLSGNNTPGSDFYECYLTSNQTGKGGTSIVDYDGDGLNSLLLAHRYKKSRDANLYPDALDDFLEFFIIGQVGSSRRLTLLSTDCKPLHSVADIDNDGTTDIVTLETIPCHENFYKVHVISDSFFFLLWKRNSSREVISHSLDYEIQLPKVPRKMFLSDFNGNGLNDMLVLYEDGYDIFWNKGGEIDNDQFQDEDVTSYYDVQSQITEGIVWNSIDYDGDGLMDYETRTSNGYYKWYLSTEMLKGDAMVAAGDFDGDGLLDFLSNSTGSPTWNLHINNGDGTFAQKEAFPSEQNPFINRHPVFDQDFTTLDDDKFHCEVFDFDGDGKQDVVITKAMYRNAVSHSPARDTTFTYWMYSTEDALKQVSVSRTNDMTTALASRYITGDFDGDGHTELINYGYNCYNSLYKKDNHFDSDHTTLFRLYDNNNLKIESGRLICVKDGYGAETLITYTTLLNQSEETRSYVHPSPMIYYKKPLCVVNSVEEDNGAAGSITTNYKFSGLAVHPQGKGWLGFHSVTKNNVTHGLSEHTHNYNYNSKYYLPTSYRTICSWGDYSSETITTMTIVDKYGSYYTYPSRVEFRDYDSNLKTTNRQYDSSYGYLVSESVSGLGLSESVSYSNYVYSGNAYRPQTVIRRNNGVGNTTKYTYDSETGKITQMIEYYGSENPLTTQYTYDSFGNMSSEIHTAADVPSTAIYYSYDSTHRFPVRIYTSPMSSVKKYSYDTWGNVITECDSVNSSINDVKTNTYDGWGNLTRTQLSGRGTITYTRGWGSDNLYCYYILEQGTSRPWIKTWYDSKDRIVKTESVGPHGISINKFVEYNDYGLMNHVLEVTGNLTLIHNYSYDCLGRIISEQHPGNNIITYSYGYDNSGRVTRTVSDNGREKTYTMDGEGNILSENGPLSRTVSYSYSSNGKIYVATVNGKNWSFGYDNHGNLTSMADPDGGTTSYSFDALGRETHKVDSRGIIITTSYDNMGRVSSIVASGSGNNNLSYNYGTEGTGQLKLISESLGNITKNYSYDTYGRIINESVTDNSLVDKSMSYQYDNNGLLISQTYPDGKTVNYTYDSYGFKIGANLSSGALAWELSDFNGASLAYRISLALGNPYIRTIEKDGNGYLMSIKMNKGNIIYQDDAYTFDPTSGNLISRTISNRPSETFSYNALSFLTSVISNGQTVMDMTYNSNGNILSKTGIGAYYYDNSSKPHSVTSVDNLNGVITSELQNVVYNEWGLASEVTSTVGNDNYRYVIQYGPDMQKVKSKLYVNNSLQYEKLYWGEYEEKVLPNETKQYHWLYADDYLTGVVEYSSSNNGTAHSFVAQTDHMGSLLKLIDKNGVEHLSTSYDVWGKRTITNNTMNIMRGFAGQEHLEEMNLIDINGRLYDPMIGRYLTPQISLNRAVSNGNYSHYSFNENNPLMYKQQTINTK